MPLTITWNQAVAAGACRRGLAAMDAALGGIDNHGRDTPVPLTTILAERGLDDTLWALCAIGAVRVQRLFAVDCAERVLHLSEAACPGDLRPREALRVARLYARGLASHGELDAAHDAAWAARAAAWDAWAGERAWQTARLRELIDREET